MFQDRKACPVVIALPRNAFLVTHAVVPLLVLGALAAGLEWSGVDLWLSAHFYDPISHTWPYKDDWFIQKGLHKGGRLVFFAIVGGMLLCLLAACKSDAQLKTYRRSLAYLFFASISGPLIIMALKNNTHIYCPWDLQLFDSFKPYIRWYDPVPAELPVGHCFPAAHAGSGYAFVSLYFFGLAVQARAKFLGLWFGLGLGAAYGLTQQMRGAHFLSHDLVALAICWFMALLLFIVFFRKQLRWL